MSEKLSQEDIDNMLTGNSGNQDSPEEVSGNDFKYLTTKEVDTIGEIGNISMGSAATTLSMLLGNKVEVTTPRVKEYAGIEEVCKSLKESVFIEIDYTTGLQGTSVLILAAQDTAIIADLMMGGDGIVKKPEIGELQLSAVGEAMNQMMGTSATALSSMFNTSIEISAPTVKYQQTDEKPELATDVLKGPIIAIAFDLKVGDLINSEMIQVISLDAAKDQVEKLMSLMNSMIENVASSVSGSTQTDSVQTAAAGMSSSVSHEIGSSERPVTVQPVQFAAFNDLNSFGETGKNLDLLMDVKLKLTVELGRSELAIKKVLELTRGSIIELDKVAGEPVELYANGKLIAKGEVVVIEDNFGLRITSIVSPDNRIKNL
ncbi:MAG: flagellar motor switch protein [uncultured bacterium]|nr:MAG: flagellar motor switch protein [uncultured bacterium]HBH17905.1 flagellar motor switch phosphatase FliY [Cyanobacteria bacterium UBA9579]